MAEEKDPRYWDLEQCAWVPGPRTAVDVPEQPKRTEAPDADDVAVAPV